jgi:hypothetical protein
MKTFRFVLIPHLVASFTALSGCDDRPAVAHKVCVNGNDEQRVEDAYCNGNHSDGIGFPFFWYYMRGSSGVPAIGASMRGFRGSFAPETGVSYGSGISRGGFGANAEGFGGGE